MLRQAKVRVIGHLNYYAITDNSEQKVARGEAEGLSSCGPPDAIGACYFM